jgi:hypothetical protein
MIAIMIIMRITTAITITTMAGTLVIMISMVHMAIMVMGITGGTIITGTAALESFSVQGIGTFTIDTRAIAGTTIATGHPGTGARTTIAMIRSGPSATRASQATTGPVRGGTRIVHTAGIGRTMTAIAQSSTAHMSTRRIHICTMTRTPMTIRIPT